MQKAKQAVLLQSTNQQLIEIRQSEIDYFVSCFSTYGIQCVVIAGVQLNSVQQVLPENLSIPRWLKTWFWISCTMTIALCCHVLIVTSVAIVFGPGLALRGPLGSMMRAVNGLVVEHRHIYTSYVWTFVWFGKALLILRLHFQIQLFYLA